MKHKHLIILFILLPVSLCAQLYYLVLDGQKAPNYRVWVYGKEIAQSADGGVIKLDEVSNLADMLFISPTGVQYEGKQDEFVPEYILLSPVAMERVIIQAIGQKNAPVAQSNLNAKDIEELNLGRDIPMLLDMLPGTVVSSDAGAGVGYTDIRIRGTDGTRTNVTVNGVPINDAESQGTYWVNMPDLASSAQNIQVQRGAGTSTNGPGAFGASINVQTGSINDAYGYFQSSAGSFNTFKNTVAGGTG